MTAWYCACTSTLVAWVLPVLLVVLPDPVMRAGGGLATGAGCAGGVAAAAGAGAGATGGVTAGVAVVVLLVFKMVESSWLNVSVERVG